MKAHTFSKTNVHLQQLIAIQQQVVELSVRRKHIRSALSGQHLSRLRGRGMEFDEVRIYQAGDEVNSIDWKVTARKGVTHTKVFREERERPVLISLDYRKNMFFATQGALKSVIATQAAALLAWHSISHGDRLGGFLFSDDIHHEIKPTRGRKGVLKFLHQCCQSNAWQQQHSHVASSSFEETTQRLRRVSKPGSLIYILSDFHDLNQTSISNLVQLAKHNDVVLISIYDNIEAQPLDIGTYPIFDGEKYFHCTIDKNFQQTLQQQYQQRLSTLDNLQKQHGLQHLALATHHDVFSYIRENLWAV